MASPPAPSPADIAGWTRPNLMSRPVSAGLVPLAQAAGIVMPARMSSDRGQRAGLRHYSKEEYVDALLRHRDAQVQAQGGDAAAAAAAAGSSAVTELILSMIIIAPSNRSDLTRR